LPVSRRRKRRSVAASAARSTCEGRRCADERR
jgi:hypothetical protein